MYEILKGVSMKSVLSWLIKNFCKPIVLKTLGIIILSQQAVKHWSLGR